MKKYRHRIMAVIAMLMITGISTKIYTFIFENIPIVFAMIVGLFSGVVLVLLLLLLYCYASAQDEEL